MDIESIAKALTEIDSDLSQINDPLEPLKVASALNSEILKFEYRKEHKPDQISPLDYTIMAALMRQLPTKPKELKNIYPYGQYECPTCGCAVTECRDRNVRAFGTMTDVIRLKRCCNCGQVIKWEDE